MTTTESGRACRHCRARKVKCDRAVPSCRACSRLGFHCSMSESGTSSLAENENGQPLSPLSLTQAGIKRRRALQACQQCRAQKAKCSGKSKGSDCCRRCQAKARSCTWRITDENEYEEVDGDAEITMDTHLPTPKRTNSGLTREMSVPEPPSNGDFIVDKATARRYINAYFSKTNPMTCIFLHKPSILVAWSKGELDPLLFKVLCASGSSLVDNSYDPPSSREINDSTARTWIYQAQTDLLVHHLGHFSVTQLYSLVLIVLFHFNAGEISQAWDLVALAARRAFALQLNHEHHELGSTAQESRRRVMWAIYILDRFFSGGIKDLAICPSERMHVRLPCDNASFERGVSSQAGYLGVNVGSDDAAQRSSSSHGTDVLAHFIQLIETREKILRYTKGVRRSGISPMATKDKLEDLQREPQTLQDQLPEDLRLSSSQLLLKSHSIDRDGYILLHTMWFQCHCDLYRFLIPGIRESVSKDAMHATPSAFIQTCQHACLSNAIQLCNLWSATCANLRDLSQEAVNDLLLPISIYQVSQILNHLRHLLPQRPHECSLEKLREQLQDTLEMASAIPNLSPRASNCLRDVQQVLEALGRDGDQGNKKDTPISRDTSEACADEDSPVNNTVTEDMEYLPSRHSLIPCATTNPDDSELSYKNLEPDHPHHTTTWNDDFSPRNYSSGISPSNFNTIVPHESATPYSLSVAPELESTNEGFAYTTSSIHPFTGLRENMLQQESIPPSLVDDGYQALGNLWDPFSMELNGYFGVELSHLFMSPADGT